MARNLQMTEQQRTALRIIAAARDTSSQEIISAAIDALIMSEMRQDRILTLAIAKALGVSWENLEAMVTLDAVNVGAMLASA